MTATSLGPYDSALLHPAFEVARRSPEVDDYPSTAVCATGLESFSARNAFASSNLIAVPRARRRKQGLTSRDRRPLFGPIEFAGVDGCRAMFS